MHAHRISKLKCRPLGILPRTQIPNVHVCTPVYIAVCVHHAPHGLATEAHTYASCESTRALVSLRTDLFADETHALLAFIDNVHYAFAALLHNQKQQQSDTGTV